MTDAEKIAALEADLAEIHTVLLAAARDVRPSETREDTPTPLLARQVASLAVSTKLALEEARLCLLAEAGDPKGAREDWRWTGDSWRFKRGDVGAYLWRDDAKRLRWNPGTGGADVPAGLTIREAMRWVEREVGL